MRWLICALVAGLHTKKFLAELGKKPKLQIYIYTEARGFFDHFFYLKASNCCGVSGTISLTLDMHLHLHSFNFLVCEHLCPWQDCADVQARLSLRWLHVREVP